MTVPTITEFITARLDGWEQAAREATPGPWSAADEHGLMPGATPAWCVSQLTPTGAYVQDIAGIPQGGDSEEADARHIALHDPAATLALVAALRAVAELHWLIAGSCVECGDHHMDLCPTLRHLAAAWVDHPDYDGSWRP